MSGGPHERQHTDVLAGPQRRRDSTALRTAAELPSSEGLGREERRRVDTITTTLKREWFAKIVDGSKRVEYREIKP